MGAFGNRRLLGALGRRGHLRALGRRGHLRALARSGLWGALARSGLWGALARSGLWGALARSRHCRALARSKKLSRHRRIPSLQHSPLVSGRSMGRWELAPCQNRERMVASSNAMAAASPQNSREYSGKGRSRWAREMKRAAISIAAGARKTGNKKLFKTGGKTKMGGNGTEVTLRSSLLSHSRGNRETRR